MNMIYVVYAVLFIICTALALTGIILFATMRKEQNGHKIGIAAAAAGIIGFFACFVLAVSANAAIGISTSLLERLSIFASISTPDKDTPAESADESAPPAPTDGWFEEGTYKVGKDIPAGEYYFVSTGRYDATVRRKESRFDEGYQNSCYFRSFRYATVEEGEYLFVEDAKFTSAANAPVLEPDENGVYQPGEYRCGIDIPAGLYFIRSSVDAASVITTSKSSLDYEDEFLHYSISDFGYARVEEGDHLILEKCTAVPAEDHPKPAIGYDGWHSAGMYEVGTDIPAGIYFVEAGVYENSCFFEIYTDLKKDIDCNDFFYYNSYIALSDGDYFNLERGHFIEAQEAPSRKPQDGIYEEGCYLIGKDIPVGTYHFKKKTNDNKYMSAELIQIPRGSHTRAIVSCYEEKALTGQENLYLKVKNATFTITE